MTFGYTLLMLTILMTSGCPGTDGIWIISDNTITVRVFNNTDFDIDPGIEFGRSDFSLLFLDLGVIEPGEIVEASINCDDILVLTATDATQFGLFSDFVLSPLPLFDLGIEYFCGEVVLFEFVGNGTSFDVFVDAGGENIF